MKVKKFENYQKLNEHEGAGEDDVELSPEFISDMERLNKYSGNTQDRLTRIEEKLDELLDLIKNS